MAGIKHFINFEILEGLYCLGFSWWRFCCLSVFVDMMVYSLTSGIVCSYLLLFVLQTGLLSGQSSLVLMSSSEFRLVLY